jgi:hypothetical protein
MGFILPVVSFKFTFTYAKDLKNAVIPGLTWNPFFCKAKVTLFSEVPERKRRKTLQQRKESV